jgi:protocatechuate 3,4-dioxygenase beta subunit
MSPKSKTLGLLGTLLLTLAAVWFYGSITGGVTGVLPDSGANPSVVDPIGSDSKGAELRSKDGAESGRTMIAVDPNSITGVRGVVLDARTRAPLPGVEVVAMRLIPNLERPMTRLRSMFSEGLYVDTSRPTKILGSTTTLGDGSFELIGLPKGRVFLDARSDRAYVRNPGVVRLARGQVQEKIELLASPGGRIVGRVVGPEGVPSSNTRVSVRPGLNSFLGQLTQRKYKWLEVMTDENGRYDLAGVPTGDGYSITYASPDMALEERHGIDVDVGKTVTIDIQGKIGAMVAGRAIDANGGPIQGAQVAMVYLDISRMLFSADGRGQAITTDENGFFELQHVAAGRVAFIAATQNLAPSNIHELAVVDGGVYNDIVLTLAEGRTFTGLVVDGEDRPLRGVDVEIRPLDFDGMESNGSNALKVALKIRRVKAETDASGRFTTGGIAGDRLVMTFTKPGYITIRKSGIRVDVEEFKVEMTRGVTLRGRVQLADGTPIPRFRVRARSREDRSDSAKSDTEPSASTESEGGGSRDKNKNDDERFGIRVEFGVGENEESSDRRRWGGRGRDQGRRLGRTERRREGSSSDENSDGDSSWDEIKSAAGRFSISGIPSGKIEVSIRAAGFLNPASQEVVLQPGAVSEELLFLVDLGAICRGIVKDAATGDPVPEATVTAYKAKKKEGDGFLKLFKPDMDGEDFDFLGMAGKEGRRSSMTDSRGEFEIKGLESGSYRFTARHPDMAKASAKDVAVTVERPTEDLEIMLETGGVIEGVVTGKGQLPLGSAMVVAVSLQAGSFKSDATDTRGFYRIDGLPSGHYIVFKSKMNEGTADIGMDLMNNMRLKTTVVRHNRTTRRDIHDETDDSVRIYGTVRDAGKPVSRAVITVLGRDKDGILGMGVRTKATADDGTYEILGLGVGDYLVQVARFRSRAEQSNITVEIPEGVREFRFDIDLPQSYLEGQVLNSAGNPVVGVQVQVGLQGDAPMDGLLGIMLKNGIAQDRTDADGRFKIQGLAEGRYRLTASGRGIRFGAGMPREARGGKSEYGQVAMDNLVLDGLNPQTNLVLVLPMAGSITGIVVDGEGNPVAGAGIHTASDDAGKRRERSAEKLVTDLFGLQMQPTKSGADGRFEVKGLTPGTFQVRAEVDGLTPGRKDGVVVSEGQATEVRLRVIKGATLKVRVRNINGDNMPLANISVLDSQGKSVVSNVSVMSVFMKYMRGKKEKGSSGWHELGGIPPDTYTLIVREKGQPEMKIVRTIRDGEKATWDIDMAAELERHKANKKK